MGEVIKFFAVSAINLLSPIVDERECPIRINDADTDRTGFDNPLKEIPFLLELCFDFLGPCLDAVENDSLR